ncbi:LmbE family N-acetylglucosaminyl deacetylase [Krasilnikovia cinnamomea]|uniref:LmbE family N-acetylglucosaminyl deacetylase n=1 Tax=Krasilnikovia cinnamomea TaxID=349313 RepID=A0A4V6MG41_9ACTN|nr:PIG-L deacetylase family protein [Krasilnikovia cinnamomea]RZU50546.1 LmbE family N-acetylglucosaminyl deacetylase [Krasilnikovia cinnamomea]
MTGDAPTVPHPLQPVNEDWQRALAIVAHPDDLEFGAAAAVARWTGQGKAVNYVLVTSGEAGIDGLDPAEAGPARETEQRESAAIVGVTQVDFLRLPDGVLEYGVALRRELCRVIRTHRPDIVLTNNFRDSWDEAGDALNMSDHIVTGRAVLDAARDAGNRWVFREQIDAGLEKWGGVREVWAAGSPRAKHGVDTTDTFELGVRSLEAHAAYLRGLGSGDFDSGEFLEGFARQTGSRLGVRYGAGFEVFYLNLY